jgi:ribosomal protein S18 acetylase RimI-like enzyme
MLLSIVLGSLETEVEIRAFEEKYKGEVIRLWNECDLVVPQNDPAKDIERKLKVDRDLFLLGFIDGKVVATVMGGYEGHRGWINYLAVKPTQQRKGYGQAMMNAVESLIEQKGCPKINLQVRNTNESVLKFYSAIGYEVGDVIGLGKRLEDDSQ